MISRPLLLTLALVAVPLLAAPGQEPAPQEQSLVLPRFTLTRPPPQPHAPAKPIPGPQRPPVPTTTFEEMIAGGKREQVVAMLAAALRNLHTISQDKNLGEWNVRTFDLDYGLGRASEEAKRLGIEDDLAKAMAPGPDAGLAERRLHALLLSRIANHQAEALAALRPVHAEMPADRLMTLAFFACLPDAERAGIIDRFRQGELPPAETSGLFLSLWGRGPSSAGPRPDPLLRTPGVVRGVATLLERMPVGEPLPGDLTWIQTEAQWIFGSGTWDGAFVSTLGKPESTWEDDLPETLPAAVASRALAARQLYTAMLRHPQFSTLGYLLFSSGQPGLGLSTGDLQTALQTALETRLRYATTVDFTRDRLGMEGSFSPAYPPQSPLSYRTIELESGMLPATALRRAAAAGMLPDLLRGENLRSFYLASGQDAKLRRLLAVVMTPGIEPLAHWWREGEADPARRDADLGNLFIMMTLADRSDLFRQLEDLEMKALTSSSDAGPLLGVPLQNCVSFLAAILNRPDADFESDATFLRMACGILGPVESWPVREADSPLADSRNPPGMGALQAIVADLDKMPEGPALVTRFLAEGPGKRIAGFFHRGP